MVPTRVLYAVDLLASRGSGMLAIAETTSNRLCATKIALVMRHWSGKHRRVIQGINLISVAWIDDTGRLRCDFCVYIRDQDR